MITCEVIKEFTLNDYDKIKDTIKRRSIDVEGKLLVGDTFKCDKEMAEYLTGKNEEGYVVVTIIEVEPRVSKKKKK